tara:strand:- start:1119 stop:1436 length:318 start_codon:yes stop_codon:yes gene_type:complete
MDFKYLTDHLQLVNESSNQGYLPANNKSGKYSRGVGTMTPLRKAAMTGDAQALQNQLAMYDVPEVHEIQALYRETLKKVREANNAGDIKLKQDLKKVLKILLSVL